MSLAYFPFYSDRFEAKTTHLTLLEDGAYNRLLRLCWRTPGCKLPNDMAWIFRQLRVTSEDERAAVLAVLSEFFTKGRGKIWNARLLEVHVQVSVEHCKKSEAGKKGVAAKALKNNKTDSSEAKAELKRSSSNQNQNQTVREDGGGGSACEREAEIPLEMTDRELILEAIGVDQVSGLTGHGGRQLGTQSDMAEAARWLELPGLNIGTVCAEIRRLIEAKRDGPPKSFRYFTEAMQRLSGALSQPALTPAIGQTRPATQANGETEQERLLRIMRQAGIPTSAEQIQ